MVAKIGAGYRNRKATFPFYEGLDGTQGSRDRKKTKCGADTNPKRASSYNRLWRYLARCDGIHEGRVYVPILPLAARPPITGFGRGAQVVPARAAQIPN